MHEPLPFKASSTTLPNKVKPQKSDSFARRAEAAVSITKLLHHPFKKGRSGKEAGAANKETL